jgi:putative nucleotidyltransferase with HDIG domain
MFLIISFILGFIAGALVIFKQKTRVPKDIETSLKKAIVIPPPPAPALSESELMQKMRVDTLEKKILYEEELSLIFKMGQEMFSSISFENITKSIAESANKIINAQICTLLLEDKTTDCFVPIYSQGVEPQSINQVRLKRGEGISGWVALHNQMLVKNDIENDPWFKRQNKGEYFVQSLVSIPLSTKERVIGVLNLSNKKSQQPFADDEIEFLKGLTCEASIALQNASLYEQIQDSYLRTITALAFALDARDSYTRQHSENVTRYAVAIAQEMNLGPSQIEHIRRAGLLHDIGKIGIRDGVLLKPAKLSKEEYGDIKQHPIKGEVIVSALPFLKEEAKLIRHHHERYDGGGYPDGISGASIEKGARILAVADAFDAMVENRVYRQALGINTTCQELKQGSGRQFDPEAVEALLRILEKNPDFLGGGK